MENNKLSQSIQYLKGVGERRAKLFAKLGVDTVGALLRYYPRGYLDARNANEVGTAPLGVPCAVRATVYSKSLPLRVRGGKTLSRVHAGDESAELEILYFNNPYAPQALEAGREYVFFGKLSGNLLSREMTNPYVLSEKELNTLMPRYTVTEGISSKIISTTIKTALESCADDITETLPAFLLDKYSLMSRVEALTAIHFPQNEQQAADAKARLIFEELLTLQLGMHLMKSRNKTATSVEISADGVDTFIKALPYTLTGAQRRCVGEILSDLKRDEPMSRLLQGDVGSGKTVVAACAIYCAAKSGYQSAVMAPTEILANQHAETLAKLLEPFGITVGLLTAAVKGKARTTLLANLEKGEVDVIVGTHAVISEGVRFKNLGFVAADEQHRFGVEQRALLSKKGDHPHLLVMSATPIPRTLALIIYGDLDLSVIDEMPPGRKSIKTYVVSDELRARYLGFVRKNADAGRQTYIVCPLVEDSEALGDTLSAVEYKQQLAENYLKELTVGLVHGRMKSKEKAAVMEAFSRGELAVLVSTTVIEVGVDVPNATLMIVENAERFGLSALHQLRGRIGRGADESVCVLVSSTDSETAARRLAVMKETANGFEIAQHDLKTRGPGDFFGKRQHGLPELHIADLATDEDILYRAADSVKALVARDPQLTSDELAPLREQVQRMFETSTGTLN